MRTRVFFGGGGGVCVVVGGVVVGEECGGWTSADGSGSWAALRKVAHARGVCGRGARRRGGLAPVPSMRAK